MRASFKNDFLSIGQFDDVELQDLSVLCGLNGAGKTHFLKAIQAGSVDVDGIERSGIQYFDLGSFQVSKQSEELNISLAHKPKVIDELYSSFMAKIKGPLAAARVSLGEAYHEISDICGRTGSSMWSIENTCVKEQHVELLKAYRAQVEKIILSSGVASNRDRAALLEMAKRLPMSLDQAPKQDWIRYFVYFDHSGEMLSTNIGAIFSDYYARMEENQYLGYRESRKLTEDRALSDEEFEARFGPKPWVSLNNLIQEMCGLQYFFTNPEGLRRDEKFELQLRSGTDADLVVRLTQLSSGERVLLALAVSVFSLRLSGKEVSLLLLDEIDASLHPQMINILYYVISEFFIAQGMKVIISTHSPTAIAMAPEGSVFLIDKTAEKFIRSVSGRDAVSTVTQGFATLDEGVRLFDIISKTKISIITEGKNSLLLREAFKLYEVDDVDVVVGAEGRSGKNQLKTLFDFFQCVSHDKPVIFVWDCDVRGEKKFDQLASDESTVPFIFERNLENELCPKGVENLFDMDLMKDFCVSRGGKIAFDMYSRKNDFANLLLERSDPEDFRLFLPLINLIRKLIAN